MVATAVYTLPKSFFDGPESRCSALLKLAREVCTALYVINRLEFDFPQNILL